MLSYQLNAVFTVVHPLVQVPNQLVGAPVLTDVTLICNVEASPKAINYWQRENGKYPRHYTTRHDFFGLLVCLLHCLFFCLPAFPISLSDSWFINLSMPQFVFIWFVLRCWNIWMWQHQVHFTYIANVTLQILVSFSTWNSFSYVLSSCHMSHISHISTQNWYMFYITLHSLF